MGFVYLMNISGTNQYKIGKTKNLAELRVAQLQTAVPVKLKLIHTYESNYYNEIETTLHNILSHKKYVPEDFNNLLGEWFVFNEYDINDFTAKCQQIDDTLWFLKQN